jgi:multiple sugar transport system substrate-binding protein
MATLELTVPLHTDQSANYLRRALERISQAHGTYSIQITSMPWVTAWNDLVNIGLHRTGADLSEVGTTWISNLVAMNALRPFAVGEVAAMGGKAAFLPATWQSASVLGDETVWAIPWLADARVIYYWRDMLEESGVDATTAFQTSDNLVAAFERLRASDVSHPWAVVTTSHTHDTLYHALSWVWGAGGEFVSADGKRPLFHQPEARTGLRAYFGLHRYMPPEPIGLTNDHILDLFLNRQTTAIMSGPWLLNALRANAEVSAHLGIALPPGPPFVGGLNLVIWQHIHSSLARAAVELVQYLVTEQIQVEYSQLAGFLPARPDLLAQPPFSTDPYYQVLAEALKHGRAHTAIACWGLVEERLTVALNGIWAEIRRQPDRDLDALMAQYLEPLARRLAITLAD